jgi:hypothetical protein
MIPVHDLLYAHGCLCHYAKTTNFTKKEDAERLRNVINSFQFDLIGYLIKNPKPFILREDNFLGSIWYVQPDGGWIQDLPAVSNASHHSA